VCCGRHQPRDEHRSAVTQRALRSVCDPFARFCDLFAIPRPPNIPEKARKLPRQSLLFAVHSVRLRGPSQTLVISGRRDLNSGPHRPESLGQVAWFPQNACKDAGSGYSCRLQLVRYCLRYVWIWAVGGPSLQKLLGLSPGGRRTSQPLLIAAGSAPRSATSGWRPMIVAPGRCRGLGV
jgi:hypothetical protein